MSGALLITPQELKESKLKNLSKVSSRAYLNSVQELTESKGNNNNIINNKLNNNHSIFFAEYDEKVYFYYKVLFIAILRLSAMPKSTSFQKEVTADAGFRMQSCQLLGLPFKGAVTE